MKIFQVIQRPQLRGAEIFCCQLSTHLAIQGHECVIVSVFPGQDKLPFQGEIIELNRPIKLRLFDYGGWKLFDKLVRINKPDLIQANAADTLKFTVLSKIFFGWSTPIVFRNANLMSAFVDTRTKYFLNSFLLRRTTHIISVSQNCNDDLHNFFGIAKDKVDTVEIGVNLDEIGSIPSDLLHIFSKGPVLLNVGSFVPEKNHKGLIKMFKKVIETDDSVQLLIIGTGKLEKELHSYVDELGMNDRVFFAGPRKDVLQIMKASSAFLLPSYIEGLPGVILEAMYAQCPVVANNVGGISEVIRDRETGFLIEKGNEAAFVNSIVSLLRDSCLKKSIKEKAYSFVRSNFDNSKISERFAIVYGNVLKSKAHSSN